MSTNIVIEKVGEGVEAIRSAASSVLEALDDYDFTELRDGLTDLRNTMAEARRIGVPQADIERALEDVRQSYPGVAEAWSVILEQLEVSVWLEDPDGEHVRGDTEIIDRIIWENWDDDEILEEVVYQLHADLEANWEVVGVAAGNEELTAEVEKKPVTLRSLLTRSHGKLRHVYGNWKTAYGLVVHPKSKLTYERFMALRDEPLSLLDENSYGKYYELRDHEVDHEIFLQSDGRVFITDFEAEEVEA